MSVVVEYHSHVGVRTAVDADNVMMVCDHINLDGVYCTYRWPEAARARAGAGSHTTSREAIERYLQANRFEHDTMKAVAEAAPVLAGDQLGPVHAPSVRGGDGLGYGRCTACGQTWPCEESRK